MVARKLNQIEMTTSVNAINNTNVVRENKLKNPNKVYFSFAGGHYSIDKQLLEVYKFIGNVTGLLFCMISFYITIFIISC